MLGLALAMEHIQGQPGLHKNMSFKTKERKKREKKKIKDTELKYLKCKKTYVPS